MKKLFCSIAVVVLVLASVVPVARCATCVFAFKDDSMAGNVSVFESETEICLVEIKAATEIYSFGADGCDSGYCVSGIGTTSGVATVDTEFKHGISHVVWYVFEKPTPVRVSGFKALGFIGRLFRGIFGASL